jgi:hypothetical protein
MESNSNKTFLGILCPHYDELTLFAMSFSCILLAGTHIIFEWEQYKFSASNPDLEVLLIILFFLTGLFLSFYHAFTDRQKTITEKKFMLLFAVIINGFSGIWAGSYFLQYSRGVFAVFPILNIINGFYLLMMLRAGEMNEQNISDENATINQVIVCSIVVFILFILCQFVFGFVWAETLSICVVYSTNFNLTVNGIILRLFNIANAL